MTTMIIGLLFFLFGQSSIAEPCITRDSHIQLSDYSVGYTNSSPASDPLTGSVSNFGCTWSIAFPYAYRCIGVERVGSDATQNVTRMVVYLHKFFPNSAETGSEVTNNLKIYTSTDNSNYTLLSNTLYVTTLNTLSSGDIEIVVDGLGITQPYIKVSSVRTNSSYVFGTTNLQSIISLYTLNDEIFGDNQSFVAASTGYTNSSSAANPLTESLSNFGCAWTAAFPWSYRCIGAKKGDQVANEKVSRILIDLKKLMPLSTETGAEIINDMELYVGDDNVTYKFIPGNYTKYLGRVSGGMKIVLDGLSITNQYIKLRSPRTLGGYVFGSTNMQQIVKLVHEEDRRQLFSIVGYEDSYPAIDPLTEPVSCFGAMFSTAFPYAYRCIGIKKDDSEDGLNIHQIVLRLEKYNTSSAETGEEIADDLSLYVSDDNLTYTLVPEHYSIYADIFTNRLEIVLGGLDISQKYIKLRCPRTLPSGVFWQSNLQDMMKAYCYIPSFIETLDLPRFTCGSTAFKISALAEQNETLKLSYVLPNGTAQTLWALTLSSAGVATNSGTINLQSFPAGKIKLCAELFDKNNTLIDRKDGYVFNTSGLVSSSLASDNVSVIIPQPSNLSNTWGYLSVTVGVDRVVNYNQAQSSTSTCTLSLPDAGWCAVYVGLVGGDSRAVVSGLGSGSSTGALEYWRTDIPPLPDAVGDAYIGCYDLSGGKTITIARSTGTTPLKINHLAVHKLSQSQIDIVTQTNNIAPRIIMHNDGFSGFYSGALNSEIALQNVVGAFSNVPLYSYDWSIGNTTVFNINTSSGASFGANGVDPSLYYRDGDRLAGTLVQNLLTNNINPLSVICDKGELQGTPINVTMRMNACYAPPLGSSHNGPLLNDNNNYRQRNIDGTTYAWRLSYAYPEARNHVIGVLSNALDSSVDGVHLQFLRNPPFFGYDQPIIDEYITRHGSFSSTNYMDARWQQIQRDIMTGLVDDIRQMADARAPTGKTIKLKVSFDEQNYYKQGLDVAAWVASGWVDVISPGYYGASAQDFDLSPFLTMVNGTACKIFVNVESTLVGKDPTPESESGEISIVRVIMSLNQYKKCFMDMYAQGADGLYPFNYTGTALPCAVSDMKENEIWREFREPFIDWFD